MKAMLRMHKLGMSLIAAAVLFLIAAAGMVMTAWRLRVKKRYTGGKGSLLIWVVFGFPVLHRPRQIWR